MRRPARVSVIRTCIQNVRKCATVQYSTVQGLGFWFPESAKVSHSNDLLETMTEKFDREDWDTVLHEFRDAQYAGTRVDSDTYNLALRSCRKGANVQGALMLLSEMRNDEIVATPGGHES